MRDDQMKWNAALAWSGWIILHLLTREMTATDGCKASFVKLIEPSAHSPRWVLLFLLEAACGTLEQQLLYFLPPLDLSWRAHVAEVARVGLVASLGMMEPCTRFALAREVSPRPCRGQRRGRLGPGKNRGCQLSEVRQAVHFT
jgi:hypothetical protein